MEVLGRVFDGRFGAPPICNVKFLSFSGGGFRGPEGAGGVVEILARPEVGAHYQKSADALIDVPERVDLELFEQDWRVEVESGVCLRETGALSDNAFANGGRRRKNRKMVN